MAAESIKRKHKFYMIDIQEEHLFDYFFCRRRYDKAKKCKEMKKLTSTRREVTRRLEKADAS